MPTVILSDYDLWKTTPPEPEEDPNRCVECGGTGWIEYESIPGHECAVCNGAGTLTEGHNQGNG